MDKKLKAVEVNSDYIKFNNGYKISLGYELDHENHYLSFSFKDLIINDFKDLEFDLSSKFFFERVPGYGIRLLPMNGNPISVPGYNTDLFILNEFDQIINKY